MLTLKYPSTQRGPTFIVQVDSGFTAVIAYRRSEKAVEFDFDYVSPEQLRDLVFVPGKVLEETKGPNYRTTHRISFEDEAGILSDQDITITLLAPTDPCNRAEPNKLAAISHFHAHIKTSDTAICYSDYMTGHWPACFVTEIKCFPLTFDNFGPVVRYDCNAPDGTNKRRHDDTENYDLEIRVQSEQGIQTPDTNRNDAFSAPDARTRRGDVRTKEVKNGAGRRKVMAAFDLTPVLDNSFEMEEG